MERYLYDFNGLFLGKYKCQIDPLESKIKGETVYLIPGNSTDIEPPETTGDELARWNGDYWEIEPAIKLSFDQIKQQRIDQSNADLEAYLESHPLQWTDWNYYSITSEKQAHLTSKVTAATLAQQMGVRYTLKWNTTGDVCKEWKLEDLVELAFAIDARVSALVEYQQAKEKEIVAAQTLEELNAIVVDYDSVV